MPTVILKIRGTTGDYDPPAQFALLVLTPADATRLCRAIEAAACLADSGTFPELYRVETFEPICVAFDRVWPRGSAMPLLASSPFHGLQLDAELEQTAYRVLGVSEDEDEDEDEDERAFGYFVTEQELEITAVHCGTATMSITPEGVFFTFTGKHSASEGETGVLRYGQLQQWAGEAKHPRPYRLRDANDDPPVPRRLSLGWNAGG